MATTKNKLPKRISPCPIREAIIEIRFESDLEQEIILSMFHLAFKDDKFKPEPLPLAEVSSKLRNENPELLYKPFYKFSSNNFIYQVGSKVISIITRGEYPGWDSFRNETLSTITKIQKYSIISSVTRVAMRYINIISGNHLPDLNVNVGFHDSTYNKDYKLLEEDLIFKTVLKRDNCQVILQLSNMVGIDALETDNFNNTLIDIDVSSSPNLFLKGSKGELNKLHDIEKELFFGLLKKEFLVTLNPTY